MATSNWLKSFLEEPLPPREPRYYVSTCPDTGRAFICEVGVDHNLAEVFTRREDESLANSAQEMVDLLNEGDASWDCTETR